MGEKLSPTGRDGNGVCGIRPQGPAKTGLAPFALEAENCLDGSNTSVREAVTGPFLPDSVQRRPPELTVSE